ncbi:MAG TPA: PEP-CTERM sorting domain-containing protein, partial [Luteolibacter sp.]|nr:PEP-CTERM sorting domain-containing protein [Luteolibacter sp.]
GSGTASARTITLTGYTKGANTIAGAIGDSGTTTNITGITKSGSGNWTLSGTNTFTGTARSYGGNLTFDYSANGNTSDPLSATAVVRPSGGAVTFKGRSSGATSETIGSMVIDSPTSGGGLNTVTLDSNGGSGVALTVGTFNSTNAPQAATLIDMSSNAGNSITVNALGANVASTGTGNLLMVNQNRANIIVRDNTGYGFATLSTGSAAGATGLTSTIGKLTGDTVLTGSNASVTTNYTLNSSVSRTAALNFQTLTIDASAADITVAMGTNNIGGATGGNGRGILVTGDKNVSFTGTENGVGNGTLGTSGMNSVFVHHYGTGILSFAQGTTGGTTVLSGTGRIHFGGNIAVDNNFLVQGTTVRVTGGTDLTNARTAALVMNSGGVLEIGSDLNGATAGDFSNALGSANGNVRFYGDSGLSASGADRVVNFGGAGAMVTWGTNQFLTSNDSTTSATDGDYTFKLSSAGADAKLTLENAINLNNRNRVIDVANGSAAIDAALTGAISGDGVGFTKLGAGTMEISGTSTYSGTTRVADGRLKVSGGGINSSTQVVVSNSTLELAAGNVLNNSADITLENGRIITNGNAETTGRLALVGNNQLDLISVGNVIRFADSSAVVWGSTLVITDWTGNSAGGGSDQVYFGTNANGLTADQLSKVSFLNPNIDGVAQTGTYSAMILSTGELVAVIPEPSAMLLFMMGASGVALRRRRK